MSIMYDTPTRKRTKPNEIAYPLYICFLGVSLEEINPKAISRFVTRIDYTYTIRKVGYKSTNRRGYFTRAKVLQLKVDENQIKMDLSIFG